MSRSQYAYWKPTGMFRVHAVGTSYYRDDIEAIAQNPDGKPALVLCEAALVLDDKNPHDENAIAVVIQGKKVGHLAREYAKTYRTYMQEVPPELPPLMAYAAITNGLRTDDLAYNYTIELDIPDDLQAFVSSAQSDDEVIRINGYLPLVRQADGTHTAQVWVPTSDYNELHKHRRVGTWTTDEWHVVNFYIDNRQGIGLGFKVYEIPKAEYARLFGGQEPNASIELGSGRFATLRIEAG